MKLIFKLIITASIIFPNLVFSRDVILIEHIDNQDTANLVKQILTNKFQIPKNLIKIYGQESKCTEKTDAILQLCILRNSELEIKKIDRYVLNTAFNIFLEQKE